uniref:Inosine/uridine-preferring nucleoside hydrolase n=1 Tax=Caulobacter sp. (strain K31) TaxID=366602 RepID=B0T4E1_CAUSK
MSPTSPKLVILDTDPGVDDALALLYLRASPGLRLLAMTTVFGNADIEVTTRNALYLRDRFLPGARVYKGAAAPLRRPRLAPPVHVHGDNGLGDIALTDLRRSEPDAGAAHDRIVELVRAHPGQVTLLAIGPLTNLAKALRGAPDIAGLVAQVVVMGGAFGDGGRGGNITPFAEANIHNDPDAAAEVLAAPWPVTLIGLDVTTQCVLSNAQADDLATRGGDPGRFAWAVSRGYAAAYGRFEGLDGCCLHDVAAVAFVLHPDLFKTCRGAIEVALDGERLGQTAWTKLGPRHGVTLEANADDIVQSFMNALIAPPARVSHP